MRKYEQDLEGDPISELLSFIHDHCSIFSAAYKAAQSWLGRYATVVRTDDRN